MNFIRISILVVICLVTLNAQQFKKYIDDGVVKVNNGDYRSAIRLFERAINAMKSSPSYTSTKRGSLPSKIINYDEGTVNIQKTPENFDLEAYEEEQKEKASAQKTEIGEEDKIELPNLNSLINETPYCQPTSITKLHIYNAHCYIKIGRKSSAINELNKGILEEPKLAETYYWRGLLRLDLKKDEMGCRDIKKSKDLGFRKAAEIQKHFCSTE